MIVIVIVMLNRLVVASHLVSLTWNQWEELTLKRTSNCARARSFALIIQMFPIFDAFI